MARSPAFEGYDPAYFYFITRELLVNRNRYLEFIRKTFEMSVIARFNSLKKSPPAQLSAKERQRDANRIQRKIENDFINLINRSEPLDNF